MRDRLNNLATEMFDLKKCQIDLLKLSFTLFATIPALLGVFSFNQKNIFIICDDKHFFWFSTITVLLLLSVIPLIFPYISWIIIHKSRSLFRIASYFIFINSVADGKEYDASMSYETLYREMLNDPWLKCRFTNSNRKNFLNRWKSFKSWKNIYIERCKFAEEFFNDWEKNHSSYTGGFYERIVSMIGHMITIYIVFIFIYSLLIVNSIIEKEFIPNMVAMPYLIYNFFILLYSIYNFRLNNRYIMELSSFPFSKDAQLEMWHKSYHRLQEAPKKTPV